MSRPHTIDLRWSAIFSDFRRSSVTEADFCCQRNISLASFRYHFYKPRSSELARSCDHSPASSENRFLAVTVLPDPAPLATTSHPDLELILSNGRRIAVPSEFDSQTLRRLIPIVEEQPCSD
jgi:hypothetical protein